MVQKSKTPVVNNFFLTSHVQQQFQLARLNQ